MKEFGVEIEFANAILDDVQNDINKLYETKELLSKNNCNYNKWNCIKDDSVTVEMDKSFGGEVVSPIMNYNELSFDEIDRVCNIIKKNYGIITPNCGGHIHISSSLLKDNVEYYHNLLKLWVAYEDIIFRFGYNGTLPRDNLLIFSAPMYNMYFENQLQLEKMKNLNDFYSIPFFNEGSRDYSMNFINSRNAFMKNNTYKNTLEFRNFNGSIIMEEIKKNIDLLFALIEYSSSNDFNHKKINMVISNNYYPSSYNDAFTYFNELNVDKANELASLIFNDEKARKTFVKKYVN